MYIFVRLSTALPPRLQSGLSAYPPKVAYGYRLTRGFLHMGTGLARVPLMDTRTRTQAGMGIQTRAGYPYPCHSLVEVEAAVLRRLGRAQGEE